MNNRYILSAATLALLSTASITQADTIAGYDFNSDTSAFVTDANTTVSAFGQGASGSTFVSAATVGDNTGLDAFGNAFTTTDLGDWGAVNEGLKAGSLAVAITNNDYITFNVEASSGFTMTLTNLSFVAGRADEAKSATDWAVMSSVDGFTDGDEVGTLLVTGAQQAGDLQSFNFDLTGTGYENIAAGTNVEFRIYMWGASGAKSSSRVQIDNVLLQGTTSVVPEPGTFALLAGLTGLTSAMLRRCRA